MSENASQIEYKSTTLPVAPPTESSTTSPHTSPTSTLRSAERPIVAEHYLERPGVDNLLLIAFDKPLTTVIAGAGYGKTQAVISALRYAKRNPSWVQLSELDNHVTRFWERMAGAFDPQGLELFNSLISLGYPDTYASFDQFLKLLARGLNKPTILVLDDFHLIRNKTIMDFIELFISARLSSLSIVLISREKPDISLSGMLSKGLLARVTENDLRFTADEMADYLSIQGVSLDDEVLKDLYSYTNGWIFAIYLAGLAAQEGAIKSQNPALAVKGDLFDLIEKELFAKASKELQDFLIKISLLDVIPAGLIRELAQHDNSLISNMMQLSMFIVYDAFLDSYSVHPLFREFLLEKNDRLTEHAVIDMHDTAARWYQENQRTFEALYHYRENGRYKEVFDIIISIPGRVSGEAANTLIELIEQAPDDLVKATPLIRVVKAGYLFNNGRLEEAKGFLSSLLEEYEPLHETEEHQSVLGEVYCLLALICIVTSDYAFEAYFMKAAELLVDGSALVDYRTGIAEGINTCSINNPAAGELERYRDALFRAAPYAIKAMNGCGCGLEYLNAAESSLYTADFKAAVQYAHEAILQSKRYQQYDIEYMANFVLVRVFTARGKYAEVCKILERLMTQLETIQHAECFSLYDIISGWFNAKLGKTDQVAEWIKHEEEVQKMFAPVVIGREYLVYCDSLLAEERYYELLAFLKQTDKMYEDRGILYATIQNRITEAIVHHYLGNHAASMQHLNEAYQLTAPNDLVLQYIEYGSKMRTLINAAKLSEDCTIPKAWLDRIYTKSSSYAKIVAQMVSEHAAAHKTGKTEQLRLSKRELEVLTHLCRGMTRKEIAESCFLSLSTVNSVIKNIYRKLGAFKAADAVRIARELDLVPFMASNTDSNESHSAHR